jgi:hypothetical protein
MAVSRVHLRGSPYTFSFIDAPGQALCVQGRAERLAFLQAHLGRCTSDYFEERLQKYNLLLEAHTPEGERAALMFGDLRQIRGRAVTWPLLHLGLSVVHTAQRGRNLARLLPTVLVRRVLTTHPLKTLSLGLWLSAKCSSPASYQSLRRATAPVFFPRIGEVGLEGMPMGLLHGVQRALGLPESDSPILLGANQDARFQLPAEQYELDARVLRFYEEAVFPSRSEVLCFGLWHPMRLVPGFAAAFRGGGAA